MKPEGIRRSVRSAHRSRVAGDAPSIGKVSRTPGTGLPKVRRRKRKSKSKGKHRRKRSRRRVLANWTLLIGGAAAACLALVIWLGLHFKAKDTQVASSASALSKDEEVRVRSKFPSPPEGEAVEFVRKAVGVRDAGQLPAYFRQGIVAPPDQLDFLVNLESTDGRIVDYQWLGSMDANGLSIDGVVVVFEKDGKPRNRLAALVPDEQGTWKIDFDAFARTATGSWDDLKSGVAQVATMRVYVAPDHYYNSSFADEDQWLCVGLGSPDTDDIFMGYCEAGSPQAAAMKWLFARDETPGRAVIEIQRIEGAEPRQFKISRVLAEDWVMAGQPFDLRFE